MSEQKKPLIIFDTDMDTDCDDAGALAMLLNAQNKGRIDLLGIIADSPVKEAAPCCEVFCRRYGVEVPIGAMYEDEYLHLPRFDRYRQIRSTVRLLYNHELTKDFGKRDTDYPAAAQLYRRLLAGADDGSVTIVCVGFLTALAALLDTPADEISPLTGAELVQRKVKQLISMGEAPVKELPEMSFNYGMDACGSEQFFGKCPIPVYTTPLGSGVATGKHLTDTLPAGHPLRVAYECFVGPKTARPSWDLIAVLIAMQPDHPFVRMESYGQLTCSEAQKRIWWEESRTRSDYFALQTVPDAEVAALLNDMMTEAW